MKKFSKTNMKAIGIGLGLLLLGGSSMETPDAPVAKGMNVLQWLSLAKAAALEFQSVPLAMILATIDHESGGNRRAYSRYRLTKPRMNNGVMQNFNDKPVPEGATKAEAKAIRDSWNGHCYGLMQLQPETGAKFGLSGAGYAPSPGQPGNSYDAVKNIHAGTALLSQLMEHLKGNHRLVYIAYFAGEGDSSKKTGARGHDDPSKDRSSDGWKSLEAYAQKSLSLEAHYATLLDKDKDGDVDASDFEIADKDQG